MNRPDLREVLRANPQIDVKAVERLEAFREEMSRAGVELSPAYRISPPIGETRARQDEQRNHQKQHVACWRPR